MLKQAAVFLVLCGLLGGTCFAREDTDEQRYSLMVDGLERQYRLYVPPSYEHGTATPFLLDFHASGSSPEVEARLSGFEALAEEKGFIVAMPAAAYHRREDGVLSWNVDLKAGGADDVRFVRDLIGHISEQYSIDPSRIYATGMSGGARMSSRSGCDLSDLIAAIAPVAGVRYPEDCHPTRSVPVITFHGKRDSVNHYEHQADSPEYWRMGVEKAVAGWVGNNRCAGLPEEEVVTAVVTRVHYTGCKDDADVEFYRSEDAGHTWPGSPMAEELEEMGLGKTDMDVPATRLIWTFFESHPLAAPDN